MRYTKVYPTTGIITLGASQFGVNQEVLDTTIRNSTPIKAAVERLKEFEDEAATSYETSKVKKIYDEDILLKFGAYLGIFGIIIILATVFIFGMRAYG